MAKGIEIDVGMNVREFQRGTRDVEAGFEAVADSLDGIARAGAETGSELADGLRDGGRDAERAVDDLADTIRRDLPRASDRAADDTVRDLDRVEDSFRDLADTARRETRSGFEAAERASERSTRAMSDDLEEVSDEAKSNLSEVVSSFDGSISSIGDLLQGTLGGLASSLGPAGAIGAALGAVTIGAIISELEAGGERSEAFKEQVSELTTELLEAGEDGSVSLGYLVDKLTELASNTEAGKKSILDLDRLASGAGTSFEDLTDAFLGNEEALDRQRDAARDVIREYEQMIAAAGENTDQLDADLNSRYLWAKETVKTLDEVEKANAESSKRQQLAIEAGLPGLQAQSAAVESVQSSVDDAAGSWQDYQDAETKAVDPAAYLAGLQQRIDAATEYAANLKAAQEFLSPEAYQFLVDQGVDFAPMLQSIVGAGPELQAQMNQVYTDAANAGSAALAANTPAELPGPTLTTNADTKPATTDIFKVKDAKYAARIDTTADTRQADAQIRATANAGYSATIVAEAAVGDAQNEFDRFVRRNDGRTIQMTVDLRDRAGNPVNQ